MPISSVERVGRAHEEVALAHLARDGLHLDDRLGDAPGDEDPDAERHHEGDARAHEHHLVEGGVRGRHRGERQGQAQHADHPPGFADRTRDVQKRRVDCGAPPEIPAGGAVERRPHLGTIAVILEARHVLRVTLGLRDHAAVGRDQRDARAGGAGHACHEGLGRGAGSITQRGAGLGLEQARHRGQARLDRLDREFLERVVQVEARRQHGDAHEPDEGQRELEGDPAPDDPGQREHQPPVSSR